MSFEDPQRPLPRAPTSQPYRGPSRVRRSDGRREIWVEGEGYVPEASLAVLPTDERKSVLEARQAATEAQSVLPDLNRFIDLNRSNRTGSLFDLIGGMGNQAPMWDEGMQEMHAITDRLTPLMRRPGSGANSNLDVEMFRSALPNIRRGGQPNARIANQLRLNAGELRDYAEFLDWYVGRNQTTSGALEQFGDYLSTPRPQRTPWREFFGAGVPQRRLPPTGSTIGAAVGRPRGTPPARRRAAAAQPAPQPTQRLRWNPETGQLEPAQ